MLSVQNENIKKIIILSAYGRALWLSAELKNKGYDVVYLDFTRALGDLSPDAWDSPFGIFQTQNLQHSQISWLKEGATLEPQDSGFIFFSSKGPLEMRGPTSKLAFKRYSIPDTQMEYLRKSQALATKDFKEINSKITADPFQKKWFLNYLHQCNSSVYLENYRGTERGRPLPVTEPWILRKISRRGSQQALDLTRDKGVYVEECRCLKGFVAEGKRLKAIKWFNQENHLKESGLDLVLNFLSFDEVQVVQPHVYEEFFSKKNIVPDWFWSRFRYFVRTDDVTQVLPNAFGLVRQISLPWSHENNLVVHRGLRPDEFVVWCRMPFHYRSNKLALEGLSKSIVDVLKYHFPNFLVVSEELPIEVLPSDHQVKSPHLPVYLDSNHRDIQWIKYKNMAHLGPEAWGRLDYSFILEFQNDVFKEIIGNREKMGISRRRGRDNEIYS